MINYPAASFNEPDPTSFAAHQALFSAAGQATDPYERRRIQNMHARILDELTRSEWS